MSRNIRSLAARTVAVVASLVVVALGLPGTATAAPGPLTITPLGWNVVGLDSNNVNVGPNVFPIGGRVCNTGTNPVTNVAVNWSWLSANANITLTNTTSFTTASLGAGACRDYYFNVQITRTAAAYNTARQFQITASGDTVASVSTPANREVFVEKLVSQNRNAVTALSLADNPAAGCFGATEIVYVGSTCTVNITAKTAPGGYEQLVTAFYFNNSLFQIESFSASYPTPVGATNTQMYADGCGWDNVRTSGTYRSCIGPNGYSGGKVGGSGMTLSITFKVLGAGAQAVSGLIYDYSGSSYHYNDDGGSEPNLLSLTSTYAPTAPTAVNDTATTNEDTSIDVDVLANDSDLNGNLNAASLSVQTQPTNGTASIVGGKVRYVPTANFNGTDTLTYKICDSTSPTPLCSTATVTITVNPVNDAPDAVDDSRSTNEDAALTFDPRTNDTDPENDTLTVTGTGSASHGTVSFTGTSVTYTP
ncbi:MAG: cadherin-like domain-containing protein, partial [Actinomycetes bacterium]